MVASAPDSFDLAWQPRLETLLAAGQGAGADLVEIFLERTDHLGVLAEQETITSVSPSFGMGAGIRVLLMHRNNLLKNSSPNSTIESLFSKMALT